MRTFPERSRLNLDWPLIIKMSFNFLIKSDQWRIFGKMGAGYSGTRHRGEILTNAYGCFPDNGESKLWPELDGKNKTLKFKINIGT